MKRRAFLKTSVVASTVAGLGPALSASAAGAGTGGRREYYEWRVYRLKSEAEYALLHDYQESIVHDALHNTKDNNAVNPRLLCPFPLPQVTSSAAIL